ncbi:hypothetical protein NV226_01855 [Mycoplasma iguanae]|uniref:ICEF-II n=1 Tax=Mycoplasma iguanae TaxID=292461 RepID=A0ABY5R9K2_9MOLU|nr:hypothetical protein [Mycoplasma iguanae]UVD81459.1 hypothetical protein NV226_01855 [Mycoplasma iguanae]
MLDPSLKLNIKNELNVNEDKSAKYKWPGGAYIFPVYAALGNFQSLKDKDFPLSHVKQDRENQTKVQNEFNTLVKKYYHKPENLNFNFNLENPNLDVEIQKTVEDNSIKLNLSDYNKIITKTAQFYYKKKHSDYSWSSWWKPKNNNVDFGFVDYHYPNYKSNFINNVSNDKKNKKFGQLDIDNNYLTIKYENTTKNLDQFIHNTQKLGKQFQNINSRQSQNIDILIKLGYPIQSLWSFFTEFRYSTEPSNKIKKDTWLPLRESSLHIYSDSNVESVNDIINALMLADYIREKKTKTNLTINELKSLFNSDEFNKWREQLKKDFHGEYTEEALELTKKRLKETGYKYLYSNNKIFADKLNIMKKFPDFKYHGNTYDIKGLYPDLEQFSGNYESSNLQFSINNENKFFNELKPNNNLKNTKIKFSKINKINLNNFFKLETNFDNLTQKANLKLAVNNELIKSFFNQAFLVKYYKTMQDNLISENIFKKTFKLLNIFNNSYQNYVSFFNKFLLNGLKGKYEIEEMENILALFNAFKNNYNSINNNIFSKISNNEKVEINLSDKNITVPNINIPENKESPWVKLMNESGFKFNILESVLTWNSNSPYYDLKFNEMKFIDGSNHNDFSKQNIYNLYFNFITPVVLSQDIYVEVIKNGNSGIFEKVKLYDGNTKKFMYVSSKINNPQKNSSFIDFNSQIILRNFSIDNKNKILGNKYSSAEMTNDSMNIKLSINKLYENSSKNQGKTNNFLMKNDILYWNTSFENSNSLLKINIEKLSQKNNLNKENIITLPASIEKIEEQKLAHQYVDYSVSNKKIWKGKIINLLKNLFDSKLNFSSTSNDFGTIIDKEIYKKIFVEFSENADPLNLKLKAVPKNSLEEKLKKWILKNKIELSRLLPNNVEGQFHVVIELPPYFNKNNLEQSKLFKHLEDEYDETGKVILQYYLMKINTLKLQPKLIEPSFNNLLNWEKNDTKLYDDSQIPELISTLKDSKDKDIFGFIEFNKELLYPQIDHFVEEQSDQYFRIKYPKEINQSILHNQPVISQTIDYNLLFKNIIFHPSWIVNLDKNEILIPLNFFFRFKEKIQLPEINEEIFDEYLWYGWDSKNEKNKNLKDIAKELNELSLDSKKLLFNYEDDLEKIRDINFKITKNILTINFETKPEFSWDKNISFINIKVERNLYPVDSFQIDQKFEKIINEKNTKDLTSFIKGFNDLSLEEQIIYFKIDIKDATLQPIEKIKINYLENKTDFILNIEAILFKNFVWKNSFDKNISISIKKENSEENYKEIKINQVKLAETPKINNVKIKNFIDSNNIYTSQKLDDILNNITEEEILEMLIWEIDGTSIDKILDEISVKQENGKLVFIIKINDKYVWKDNEFNSILKSRKFNFKFKEIPKVVPIEIEKNKPLRNFNPKNDKVEVLESPNTLDQIEIVKEEQKENNNNTLIAILSAGIGFILFSIISFVLYKYWQKKNKR